MIAQLEVKELDAWRRDASREKPLVVDVRERWEFDHCRLQDSMSVPLGVLAKLATGLPRDRDIVLVCHHGSRSHHAAAWLLRAGFDRVHNLRGGIAAWAEQIEPSMKRY